MRLVVVLALALAPALALPPVDAACPAAGRITIEPRFPVLGTAPRGAGASGGACASTPIGQVDDHVIPRSSDNITVHYHADLGPGVPTVAVTLNGLGLVDATFTMDRAQEPIQNDFQYAMRGFVPVAPAQPGDDITATVTTPFGSESGTYRVV